MKATIAGLQDLRKPEEIAALRGLSVDAVLGLSKESGAAAETLTAEAPSDGEPESPPAAPATDTEPTVEAETPATEAETPGSEAEPTVDAEAAIDPAPDAEVSKS